MFGSLFILFVVVDSALLYEAEEKQLTCKGTTK